ncbi:acyl-CoA thioesterase/bile acid-CoA:amino acid N-acyltransferase family protein [Heyndrickxia sp. NPDC080065]|uniref:acyl-CoA thioesterase/bile acid-CoA:amino acid N-acyltransferase family protein n=1 Tax=Heyndrickxia sp. NPDC080065 TaxID=3390568 RepID=UPI003CFCEE6F
MSIHTQSKIIVDLHTSLIDQNINIQAVGLKPGEKYVIGLKRRSVTLKMIKYWESRALFCADANGMISLNEDAPLSGSYSGKEGMGLFWSLVVKNSQENENEPYNKLAPNEFLLYLEHEGKIIDEKRITRYWYSPEVTRIPVKESGLVGTYFRNQRANSLPGIIVVGGSEGGIFEFLAGLLASNGFNVLALGYFGVDNLPKNLANIPLEYIQSAIDWLKERKEVEKDWIGIHGTSRGGELALWSASLFPEIKAAVSMNGSPISFAGIVPWSNDLILPPAWTFKNNPLPYASPTNPVDVALECKQMWNNNENPLSFWYRSLISNQSTLEKTIIPVERINGSILFISGEQDANFDSVSFNQIAMTRLKTFKHPYSYEHLVYSGAGHEVGFPYIPILANIWTGGNKKETAHASIEAWQRTIEFFKESYKNTRK